MWLGVKTSPSGEALFVFCFFLVQCSVCCFRSEAGNVSDLVWTFSFDKESLVIVIGDRCLYFYSGLDREGGDPRQYVKGRCSRRR